MATAWELTGQLIAQIKEERSTGTETITPRNLAREILVATDPVFAAEMMVALSMGLSDAWANASERINVMAASEKDESESEDWNTGYHVAAEAAAAALRR